MRKVIIKFYEDISKTWINCVPGEFHCWGSAYEEFHAGPGNYTIAIIELPGGRIVTTLPENVKFVE